MFFANPQRAHECKKQYVDSKPTERVFPVGYKPWIRLQPYVQRIVVNHPVPKLAPKFYIPYKVLM